MLVSIGLLLLVGIIFSKIASLLRLPALIGMLVAGIVMGPSFFNVLDVKLLSISLEVREIALVIILLQAGLSLEVKDLKQMGRKAVLMSFVPACFEMTATFFAAQYFFGFDPVDAWILGAVLASASPAVIVPRMLKLMKEGYGVKKCIPQLILTGDAVDDVFNIVVFSSLLGLSRGAQISMLSFLMIPLSVLFGILLGVLIGILIVKCLKYVGDDIISLLVVLSVSLVLTSLESLLSDWIPFSGLVTIIAMGITILKQMPMKAESMTMSLEKIWKVAQIFLFVLLGASVNPGVISSAGVNAVIMIVFVLLVRALGIYLCLLGSDYSFKEKLFCMMTGIPKATVQAAIGGIPLAMGLASGEMILAISVIAILFTAPIGAILLDNSYKKLLTLN